MLFQHMPISCDLSETSLHEAAIRLGVKKIHEVTLYAARSCSKAARQIQGVDGFEVIIVPDALLPSRFAWAIEWNGQLIGSPGAL